jgi:hypothetical protein
MSRYHTVNAFLCIGLIVFGSVILHSCMRFLKPHKVYCEHISIRPEIKGDSLFYQKTSDALKLLEDFSHDAWQTVCNYVPRIKQFHRSGMNVYETPPVFEVGEATYMASTTWYASAIAHDAYHSKLYFDYKRVNGLVPADIWTGEKAEMKCLEFQISTLIQIHAPQFEIDYARSLRGTNWWNEERTW